MPIVPPSPCRYTSTLHAFRVIWREGGIRGLYRGIGYTVVRAAPVAGTILPIYESAKDYLMEAL